MTAPATWTTRQVRERGWSGGLIRDVLDPPDDCKHVFVPQTRRDGTVEYVPAVAQLYFRARVRAAEARPEVAARLKQPGWPVRRQEKR